MRRPRPVHRHKHACDKIKKLAGDQLLKIREKGETSIVSEQLTRGASDQYIDAGA